MLLCKFCNQERKNSNSLRNHERLCKSNPQRDISYFETDTSKLKKTGRPGTNQYIKAKELGLPKPILSDETRKKMSDGSKNRAWTDERRKNHSESMKLAVAKYPESYTSSNRGRTKQIEKYGVKFQGKWELAFYEYCLLNNISIVRSNEWFSYKWNGERKYFPDFYLSEYDVYIEVKGYETERDVAKWSQFPKKLCVIKQEQIAEISNNTFGLITHLARVLSS